MTSFTFLNQSWKRFDSAKLLLAWRNSYWTGGISTVDLLVLTCLNQLLLMGIFILCYKTSSFNEGANTTGPSLSVRASWFDLLVFILYVFWKKYWNLITIFFELNFYWHCNILFAGKAWIYHSVEYIKLGCKSLPWTNTLAYWVRLKVS